MENFTHTRPRGQKFAALIQLASCIDWGAVTEHIGHAIKIIVEARMIWWVLERFGL